MLLDFARYFKKPGGPDEERDIRPDLTGADFIPYAYHYDRHTLVTKNGELLQVLRITTNNDGVDYESPEPGVASLRDGIRRAIGSSVTEDHYAFWFHTLRKRTPIQYNPQFPEEFSAKLSAAWQSTRHFRHAYGNEVYISIVRQGQTTEMFNFNDLQKTLLPSRNRRFFEAHMEQIKGELDATVARVLEELAPVSNARRLSMVERADGEGGVAVYSEPLEFLHYLVNFYANAMPVSNVDASRQLVTGELTFGFDAMESRMPEGKRRFAGLLTLKGAPELSAEVLDKCLQIPEEMIITQTFHFIPAADALQKRDEARIFAEASMDPLIPYISGLQAALDSDRGRPTDFGEQHTSIAILRDQYKTLDEAVGNVQAAFADLGLISVREEIMLEDCFWAQLPSNFAFIRRRLAVVADRMAGLSRLNHFPSGKKTGNRWGEAVAILPTVLSTPYFFNFHHGEAGHTAMLDFNSFADEHGTALLNFLLVSSRQYNGRLFIFDRNHSARPLVQALGGQYYYPLGKDEPGVRAAGLNPLQLPESPRNRAFLTAWLMHFLTPGTADSTREALKGVIDALYTSPPPERTLAKAKQLIRAQHPGLLAERTSPLLDTLFGAATDIDFTAPVCAVDMLGIASHRELIIPAFSYLMHRVVTSLDGKPTIIVLNEAWDLLDNDFFQPRLNSLLDMLTENNAIIIFTTRHPENYVESHLTRQILDRTPTKLFIPDDIATDYFPAVTGLTPREVSTLIRMERQKGQFLLKHGGEVLNAMFPQEGLEAFAPTLAGDARTLRLMQIQQR